MGWPDPDPDPDPRLGAGFRRGIHDVVGEDVSVGEDVVSGFDLICPTWGVRGSYPQWLFEAPGFTPRTPRVAHTTESGRTSAGVL